MAPNQIGLKINCGYTRVAISNMYQLKGMSNLATDFRRTFRNIQGMDQPPSYWHHDRYKALFLKHCDIIMKCFAKKWNENEMKKRLLGNIFY